MLEGRGPLGWRGPVTRGVGERGLGGGLWLGREVESKEQLKVRVGWKPWTSVGPGVGALRAVEGTLHPRGSRARWLQWESEVLGFPVGRGWVAAVIVSKRQDVSSQKLASSVLCPTWLGLGQHDCQQRPALSQTG